MEGNFRQNSFNAWRSELCLLWAGNASLEFRPWWTLGKSAPINAKLARGEIRPQKSFNRHHPLIDEHNESREEGHGSHCRRPPGSSDAELGPKFQDQLLTLSWGYTWHCCSDHVLGKSFKLGVCSPVNRMPSLYAQHLLFLYYLLVSCPTGYFFSYRNRSLDFIDQ